MSDLRPTIFAPKSLSNAAQTNLHASGEVKTLVEEARRAGGLFASWRIQKQVNGEVVQSVGQAVTAHFAARREELMFRIELMVDNAKKGAIARSLEETAVIEREIVRMTNESIKDLYDGILDVSEQARLDEVRRMKALNALKERGEITDNRYEKDLRKIEKCADEIGERAEALAKRVIENLGERLAAALRTYQGDRP